MRKDIGKMIRYLRNEEEIDASRDRNTGCPPNSTKASLKARIGHLRRFIREQEGVASNATIGQYKRRLRDLLIEMAKLNN